MSARHAASLVAIAIGTCTVPGAQATSWQSIGPDAPPVRIVRPLGDGATIWAVTEDDLLRSTDGGAFWSHLDTEWPLDSTRSSPMFEDVAVDASHPSTVRVWSYWYGLLRSDDDGITFRSELDCQFCHGRFLVDPRFGIFAHLPADRLLRLDHEAPPEAVLGMASAIFGDGNGTVWARTHEGLLRSLNGGADWELVLATPAPSHPLAYAYDWAADPDRPDRVYAASLSGPGYGSQLWVSEDGGASFTVAGSLPDIRAISAPADGSDAVFVITADPFGIPELRHRLWRSDDLGATFQRLPLRQGLGRLPPVGDAGHPGSLWVAATAAGRAGIRHSTDHGVSWRESGRGGGSHVSWLAVGPTGALWAVADGWLFHAERLGSRFVRRRVAVPPTKVWSVAADPVDPQRLWLATASGLLTSGNAGASWHPMVATPPGTECREGCQLLSDPLVPGRLLTRAPGGRFAQSDNGGRSWFLGTLAGCGVARLRRLIANPAGTRRALLATAWLADEPHPHEYAAIYTAGEAARHWRGGGVGAAEDPEAAGIAGLPGLDGWLVATETGLSIRVGNRYQRPHLDRRRYRDLVSGSEAVYALVVDDDGRVTVEVSRDGGHTFLVLHRSLPGPAEPRTLLALPGAPERLLATSNRGLLILHDPALGRPERSTYRTPAVTPTDG